jgi:hypothetical protein
MSANTYNTQPLDDDDYLGTSISISSAAQNTMWGATGAVGSVLTTGSNGLYWGDYGINSSSSIITSTGSTVTIGESSKALTVKGEAEFEHDITIKGVKLMETLEKIEGRLNILRVDPVLEERWEKLRELGDAYRALQAECIDKDHIIDLLKK